MNVETRYILEAFAPELALVALAMLVLLVDLLLPRANCRKAITLIAAFGALFVGGLGVLQWMQAETTTTPAFVQRELRAAVQRAQDSVFRHEDVYQRAYALPREQQDRVFEVLVMEPADGNAQAHKQVTEYLRAQRDLSGMAPLHIGVGQPAFAVWWFFANDQFAAAFKVIFALACFLVLLLSVRYPVERYRGEFTALLLFAAFGLMVMVNTRDLVILFLGLEVAAVCLYVLTAWQKGDARSAESGTKYLLLASLASAFFIYGASLLFVKFGTTHLGLLASLIERGGHLEPLALMGLLMLLVGFAFKIAAAPFHLWAPDVYQGAPISAVAFLSTASKAAGFAVLIRVLATGFISVSGQWWLLLAVMAALSMSVGNLVALHQNNVKRLLAYSGIAQAGYLLIAVMAIGLAANTQQRELGLKAVVFYLFLYTVGNIGAFAITGIIGRETGSTEMTAFAGLRWRAPILAFTMALLLLSLGGIPLLAGFVGKWFIFMAGVDQGQYLLVLLGAALNVVSIYYYLLIVKQMYIKPAAEGATPVRTGLAAAIGLFIIIVLTVAIGIYPKPFLDLAQRTAASLLIGP